jgi:hypothetical protein
MDPANLEKLRTHGGSIEATGTNAGAGIGSGLPCERDLTVGNILISNERIAAKCSSTGAGIGLGAAEERVSRFAVGANHIFVANAHWSPFPRHSPLRGVYSFLTTG